MKPHRTRFHFADKVAVRVALKMVIGLIAASTVAVGCGGAEEIAAPSTPVPLSDDQAARLAQAGFMNFQAGGAQFEANSAFLVGQPPETLRLVGEVDWVQRSGRAVVSGTGPDASLTEVYWQSDVVMERRPAVDAIIAGRGGPSQAWIARPPEPGTRQLDRLIAIITALSLTQPDNALLLQQTEGSAFIRSDTLRGEPVEVLRYGIRNLHWLAVSDGRLMRFEGNAASGTAPTIVDLLSREPVRVQSPPRESVVRVDEVSEMYAALLGN
jgi:hypothetical protein